jgi:hypothetical protein
LGEYLLGLKLGEPESSGSAEPHAVDPHPALHPVALPGPVDELAELEGDVEAGAERRCLEVEGEQAVGREVVELALLRGPVLLPAGDDLLDPQCTSSGDADPAVDALVDALSRSTETTT